MSEIFFPVYKDTFYTTSATTLDYSVSTDEDGVIFRGRAYKGSASEIAINISKIASDYLENKYNDAKSALTTDPAVWKHQNAFKVFYLYDGAGNLLASYGILFGFDGEFEGDSKILSEPVRKDISDSQTLAFTVFSKSGETVVFEYIPAVRNTFFNLITRSLLIPAGGGEYRIQWLTDYLPASTFEVYSPGRTLPFTEPSESGITINFPAVVSDSGSTFEIYYPWNGGEKVFSATTVNQAANYFTLGISVFISPSLGGTYNIPYLTDFDPAGLSATVIGWPSTTVSTFTASGCTITVSPNPSYSDYEFGVHFKWTSGATEYDIADLPCIIKQKGGATSGDTGDTPYLFIDSAVTRDIQIQPNGTFIGFACIGGVMLAGHMSPGTHLPGYINDHNRISDYYPESYNTGAGGGLLRFMGPEFDLGPLLINGIYCNVPIGGMSIKCDTPSSASTQWLRWVTYDGYSLSSSSQVLQNRLNEMVGLNCGVSGTSTYTMMEEGVSTLSVYSGSTVMDTIAACVPSSAATPGDVEEYTVHSGCTPYEFTDIKFRFGGRTLNNYEKSTMVERLRACVPVGPPFEDTVIYDGILTYADWDSSVGIKKQFATDAFKVTGPVDGWYSITTPLPLTTYLGGWDGIFSIGFTDVWFSKNLKFIKAQKYYNGGDKIKFYYGGTQAEFRNVISVIKYHRANYEPMRCTDGNTPLIGDMWAYRGKTEQVMYRGNQIRPNLYDEYFYANTENYGVLTNSLKVVYDTTAATRSMYIYSRDSDEYYNEDIYLTESGYTAENRLYHIYTFPKQIWGVYQINTGIYSYEPVGGFIAFIGENPNLTSGVTVPYTEMRGVEGGFLSISGGASNVESAITFQNIRYIVGMNNFMNSAVKVIKAPNLINLSDVTLGLSGNSIEEIYAPSIQVIGGTLPATLTKLTIGKDFNFIKTKTPTGEDDGTFWWFNPFLTATGLTELFFNGSIAEFEKVCHTLNGKAQDYTEPAHRQPSGNFHSNTIGYHLECYSWIQIVYCDNGEYVFFP